VQNQPGELRTEVTTFKRPNNAIAELVEVSVWAYLHAIDFFIPLEDAQIQPR
jgi:hypothetical protein